jgi:hypothetical protein
MSHLADFVHSLHADPLRYNDLLQKARKASDNYTIDKVRERNRDLFDNDR